MLPGYPSATIAAENFGNVTVGGNPVQMTLTYARQNADVTLFINVTNGLDFSVGESTCANLQCSAPVTFSPRYPGVAKDAVVVSDQNGNLLYETLLYGTGGGPQFGFDLGDLTVYESVANQPDSIAVGPDGNIYLADASQSKIYKFSPDLSTSETLNIVELGVPGGIAVDGDNTIYIADKTNNRIVAYNELNEAQTTVTTSTPLSNPNGVALDGSGDLFIADTGNNRIIEIDTQGNELTIADGLNSPTSVAVDGSRDVYFVDAGNGGEVRIQPSDGELTTVATQLGTLYDIAVDAAGRVYISTSTGLTLIGQDGSIVSYGGGTNYGMAVDLAGDILTTQPASSSVAITNRASSNFILTTEVGTTTTGGDTISNTGNTPLTLSNSAISGTVFTSNDSSQCVDGTVVQPGTACDFEVDFRPAAAQAYQESYTVTSNSLNVPTTTDVDTLYGYGTGVATTTALSVSPGTAITGENVDFNASVASGGQTTLVPTGTVTLTNTAATPAATIGTITLGANGAGTYMTSSLAAGSYTIVAAYSGDANYSPSMSSAQPLTITHGTPTSLTGNLLANPGAELGSIEDWTPAGPGAPTVDTGTFDSGINPHTGSYDFLGYSGASDSLSQTVSVIQQGITAAQVDGGTLLANVSFWEQGLNQGTPSDDASVTLTFLDANNATIGTVNTGTVDSHDGTWANLTGEFAIPSGTRSITYTMNFMRNQGSDNDSFIDDNLLYISSNTGTGTGTPTPTTTALTVTAATVAYRTPVSLSAKVTGADDSTVVAGQVVFCDAAAASCNALSNLGIAQLSANNNGAAILNLAPGTIGTHSFKAVFLGTAAYATSASAAQTVSVTGIYPTSTTITATGTGGIYSLTGTVVGLGTNAVSPAGTVSFLDTSNSNALLGSGTLGAATLGFNESPSATSPYGVGRGPYGQASGDFNGDGFLDLVVQNYESGSVSVLLGNGDGTFQAQATYPVGTEPERVLVADLNGDGKLDLIVANSGSGNIGVLLGNGDGTFKTQVTYPAGGTPVGLGVMDINHDGYPDVVAGDYYQNQMAVLLGNGDGTLKAAVTYPTGATPQTLAEGDFNGDGNVDVAVGNFGGGTVGIFLGNGDGTFQTMVTYPVGTQPQGVQVGDFNGDGKQDLAVSNSANGTVGVLLGKGDGTFQPQVTYPVGTGPVGLVVADFNGDGFEDISVGNTGSNTQSVLLGNGDGTFKTQLTFATGGDPYGDTTGDFNGDGIPDISVSNFVDGTVTIFLSQVTQTATATASVTVGGSSGATHEVEASYPGDTNFSASVSQPTGLTPGGTTAGAPTLTSVSPAGGVTGSPATTITLTGGNFATTDVVYIGEGALVTTFVNATTLTAVVPANVFSEAGTYPLGVEDLATGLASGSLNFVVSVAPVVVFTGPSTATSDQQPMVTFQLVQPYAVPINCVLTLTFVPSSATGIVDPSVQFSSGGTTLNVTIPAGSTATPPVEFQTGTVAGTATVTLTITDTNGDPLTPPNVAPVVVALPATVPQITSTAAKRATGQFTVTVVGYSNTREVKTAIFHFTPMPGSVLVDPDVTVDVTGIFSQWYGMDASKPYGSTFTYTQPFNLNADPATIQSVTVTLVNSIGSSVVETAQ